MLQHIKKILYTQIAHKNACFKLYFRDNISKKSKLHHNTSDASDAPDVSEGNGRS